MTVHRKGQYSKSTPWNPDDHPRDPLGEFTKKLQGMKVGSSVSLPSGEVVMAQPVKSKGGTQRRFKIWSPVPDMNEAMKDIIAGREPEYEKTKRTAADAAREALDRSARSKHPRSIGGKTRHKSFDHAMKG